MNCARGFQSHVICNCQPRGRQAGDPIPSEAVDDLIQRTIEAGVITERYEFGPQTIVTGDPMSQSENPTP